jgi:hypothetical protein
VILLIEDELTIRTLMTEDLEGAGLPGGLNGRQMATRGACHGPG